MSTPARRMRTLEPKILYFGTPVTLISSLNGDETTNLAPISSSWALGWTFVLGILDDTQTAENLARHPECVINYPAPGMWKQVEALAPLTGRNPVPEPKVKQFRYEKDKFKAGGFTPIDSVSVKPQRASECPVHLEARVQQLTPMKGERLKALGGGIAAEVEILKVHVAEDLVLGDHHINPQAWSPLIYNFRHYFGLAGRELGRTFRAEA